LLGWLVVLPLIGLLANLLPRPSEYSDLPPRKSWLPLLIFGLWTAGCGVHLWCVGYVAGREFNPVFLIPLACVAAWTLWNRVTDLQEQPSAKLRFVLLHFPMALPFLSILYGNGHVSFILTALNVILYGVMAGFGKERSHALQLTIVCCAGLAACLPTEWGTWVLPQFDRASALCFGMGVYVIIQSLRSRHPAIGLCGAVVAGLAPALLSGRPPLNEGLQISCVFLLLHSFTWRDTDVKQGSILRFVTAATWCVHAIAWTHSDGTFARVTVPSAAVAILAVYFLLRRFRGYRPPVILAIAAGIALCATPINLVLALLGTSPIGLLSLLASFLLFGAGTILAYNKHRWHSTPALPSKPRK
ncbi:MAG TPA: hypothetical protein VMZ27_02310, partial [Candidatus Saccharimonadales bacterium]|nr:hypothetical protein [Candidatus Saccharimonadales bacterium]